MVLRSNTKSLDSHLVSRTFLVSNYLTAADVAVYGALHPVIVSLYIIHSGMWFTPR